MDDNYGLGKVLGDDETGFRGVADQPYRFEAWDFLLAGGAIFNHLDYSFTIDRPDGTWHLPPKQPGGGGRAFRKQMRILATFMKGLDLIHMAPAQNLIQPSLPDDLSARVLAKPGASYAAYLRIRTRSKTDSARSNGRLDTPTADSKRTAILTLSLPASHYRAEWIDVMSGATIKREAINHRGGNRPLASPPFESDIALRIAKR